ncbi:APC family permease [Salinisphaera sp. Q1T1-3]|uniref:APC family permease n=1 Tax=Salinisphaera sp. Q1T1-3 TaxID=2321229 RepID=UPI000E75E3A1|nr:amino acid permease [Salinisphaera sp. Q1T1-3]RJS91516.1 amino acid permease [Salinisphaera sp. Q1T1-3]
MSDTARFVRVLARRDVLALAFGAMIGWGWVVMTGHWILTAGSLGAVLAFVIGGLAIVCVGLTYAELAAAMPEAGGEHVYSYRGLGHLASFVCTWSIVLGYMTVVSFEAVALPTVVENLIPGYSVGHLWTVAGWDVNASWVAVAVLGSLVMMAINYVGVRTAALVQKLVTLLIVAVGVMFFTGALFSGNGGNLAPLVTGDPGVAAGILSVLVMVPFMFVGFDVIPQAAEEIDLPHRDIGRLLIFSVVLAVVWYAAMLFGTAYVLGHDGIDPGGLAVPDAMAAAFSGGWAGKLMVLAGMAGIVTSWNAFYIGGSRAIYALARAGMLPAVFARLHPKHRTPYAAIILIGVVSTIAPFFGRSTGVWLVDAGGLGIVIAYLFVAASFVALRYREPDMPRPFRTAGGVTLGVIAVVLSVLIVGLYLPFSPSALKPVEWAIFAIWMMAGLGMYIWARARYGLEPARHVGRTSS